MATIDTSPTAVRVRFRPLEKLLGLVRDTAVPLSAVRRVEVVTDSVAAPRGIRAPGLALPTRRKVGTWRGRDGTTLVSVSAGVPAVRLELTGQRYAVILVSTPDADRVAADVRAAMAAGEGSTPAR